jgi:PAS domain-containing protein
MNYNNRTKKDLIDELIKSEQRISDLEILERSHRKAARVLRKREAELKTFIESINEGILSINNTGQVLYLNRRFADMWRIPDKLLRTKNDKKIIDHILKQLIEPEVFLSNVQYGNESSEADSDIIALKDGRTFEYHSNTLRIGGDVTGRVLSFHDVTRHKSGETEPGHLTSTIKKI